MMVGAANTRVGVRVGQGASVNQVCDLRMDISNNGAITLTAPVVLMTIDAW
jgi:hypothetical protein